MNWAVYIYSLWTREFPEHSAERRNLGRTRKILWVKEIRWNSEENKTGSQNKVPEKRYAEGPPQYLSRCWLAHACEETNWAWERNQQKVLKGWINWNSSKIQNFCALNDTIRKMKTMDWTGRNYLQNTSDKRLVSRLYKNKTKQNLLNNVKGNNSIKKNRQMISVDILPKKTYEWPINTRSTLH